MLKVAPLGKRVLKAGLRPIDRKRLWWQALKDLPTVLIDGSEDCSLKA
jgi:hypothetical protein